MSIKTLSTSTLQVELKAEKGLVVGTDSDPVTLDDGSSLGGPQDVTIYGDLYVKGQTTTIQSSTLTIDDAMIKLGDVAQITGIATTTNLVQGQTNVIVASTSGLVPGMTLTKTSSGGGSFNASGATIASITNATTFVASATHAEGGAITFTAGGASDATANGGGITIEAGGDDKSLLWQSDTDSWEFNHSVLPHTDSAINLGSSAVRWANIYADDVHTGDLHLSNERGSWTVVEEANYLTIRNNKNGKRYRLLMEELPEDED